MGEGMTRLGKILLCGALLFSLPARAQEVQYYDYANNNAEYSVRLPEVPTVRTIWTDDGLTLGGFVDDYPTDTSAVGEIALLNRVDFDTDETYQVKIFFLKANSSFLKGLSDQSILARLKGYLKDYSWKDEKFQIVGDKLKWATLSGFTTDEGHRPVFNAIHYLTGASSVLIIEVHYNFENKLFRNYYKTMLEGVIYHAP